jgi:plasmid maintenance system antidote protein VapI
VEETVAFDVLREEFLQPMSVTPDRLAKEIGVPLTRITSILAGRRAIAADTDYCDRVARSGTKRALRARSPVSERVTSLA